MMIKHYFLALTAVFSLILFSCNSKQASEKEKGVVQTNTQESIQRDLNDIKKEGVINVLTTYSSTSYFLYRGQPMGYEYELLKRFADHLGVQLNLMITNDIETMHNELTTGEADLIAHGLTITKKRKEYAQFSDYLYLTKQVLVQKKPDNWRKLKWKALENSLIHDPIELIGDTVSVRARSSYINRLANLSEELGGDIYIDTLPGELSTDRIIEMVAEEKIKYTVADENIAAINASYYPILNIDVPISFSQRIAWAMRHNSPQLKEALNA